MRKATDGYTRLSVEGLLYPGTSRKKKPRKEQVKEDEQIQKDRQQLYNSTEKGGYKEAHRDIFVGTTFVIVLFSILVQGFTIERFVRILGGR